MTKVVSALEQTYWETNIIIQVCSCTCVCVMVTYTGLPQKVSHYQIIKKSH